jgi:hypothetical protein
MQGGGCSHSFKVHIYKFAQAQVQIRCLWFCSTVVIDVRAFWTTTKSTAQGHLIQRKNSVTEAFNTFF